MQIQRPGRGAVEDMIVIEVRASPRVASWITCSLASTLALLDRLGTSLYEDALIPVALAHSFASIPLRTGSKVLTLLSRELLGLAGGPR